MNQQPLKQQPLKPKLCEGINPRTQASRWSRMTYSWVNDFLNSVYKDEYFKTLAPQKDGSTTEQKTHVINSKMLGTLFRPSSEDVSEE